MPMQALSFEWRSMPYTNIDLSGKSILVTGAADGIGRAVTLLLAKHNATVIMLDRKTRHLEKLYDQITSNGSTEPIILPVDLNEITAETATQLAQALYDDLGKLDSVLHNAAELGSPSPMDQYDMDYWQQVMQVNLHAPYLLTRALLPLLKIPERANIVFSSAGCGRQPSAYWGAYGIAYAGVEAQMSTWATELANTSNIHVNSVDPGAVRTVLRRRSHPGEDQNSIIAPHEIAPAYLHLLSDSTSFKGKQLTLQDAAS